MTPSPDPWGAFSHDPRDPANAVLRASDQDRNHIHQVLAEAYADGRLDREEFDLRTEQTGGARTLGELPALVSDLVVTSTSSSLVRPPADLQQRAVRAYESDRREALLGFLVPSLVCLAIWFAFSWNHGELELGFPWPLFVVAGTGVNLIRTLARRADITDEHLRRLEKKRAKELRARRTEEGTE